MNVHELTRDQMIQLKQAYLTKLDEEGTLNDVLYNDPDDETGLTYDELANADTLIPDAIVYNEYAGYEFVPEDFSLANPNALTIEVSNINWDIDDDDIIERFGSLLDDNELLTLEAGQCHYCPQGHTHSLINDSEEDLVFFAVVPTAPQQKGTD